MVLVVLKRYHIGHLCQSPDVACAIFLADLPPLR
jgi:hypothetical protein